jgi:hypothetical protein
MQAAMIAGRSSMGYEIESALEPLLMADPDAVCDLANTLIDRRLADHRVFVANRESAGKAIKYTNTPYGFPVITRQETGLHLPRPVRIQPAGKHRWRVDYAPQSEAGAQEVPVSAPGDSGAAAPASKRPQQRALFG